MAYWISLSGRERQEAVSAVWDMVQATYAKIGLIVDQPRELYEYDNWELFVDDGTWVAFVLSKTTPFGQKLGLAGSDGSRAGRKAVKDYVASSFFDSGRYAEVSHRMEELAFEAGAPIVCAVYARDVLKKSIEPTSDGVHYRRAIKGVGDVTKVIIGLSRRRLSMHSRRRTVDRSKAAVHADALSKIKL